ncbi:MAG: sigma-70 family RNA polymerase sigma factor [Deltaproteobacteria bacterium]|nr:sigma-70 family RNA polymerase sigma factor [Deltaproteobacteria bacterium]
MSDDTDIRAGSGSFPTTLLEIVDGARSEDAAIRARAHDAIVLGYWRPVYKTLRIAWGRSNEDAKDLTQGFFERALSRDFFADYEPAKGRFRTFLRVCLERWVSNELRAAVRQKRGGGKVALPLDWESAESEIDRASLEAGAGDVERVFEREWARSLFSSAVEALHGECAASGKHELFVLFERYDLADSDGDRPTYQSLADELGIKVTDVTNRLHAVRRSLRRIVLEKLAEMTASEEELREEARSLLGADAG